jgi:hypothetical protein
LNNPLIVIDIDGKFPWTIYVRSFIFTSTAGLGWWRGDGRGPSTDTSSSTTSRISLNFTFDYDRGQITQPFIKSDLSEFYGIPGGVKEQGAPSVQFSPLGKLGPTASVDFHYRGNDPIPGYITPDVDVFGNLSIAEDRQKNILTVSGSFTGDKYPSTEAFIVDQSGSKVFLGAKYEEGDIRNARGQNRDPIFKVDLRIRFNDKGNFVAVTQGRRTYTIEEWNKRVQGDF